MSSTNEIKSVEEVATKETVGSEVPVSEEAPAQEASNESQISEEASASEVSGENHASAEASVSEASSETQASEGASMSESSSDSQSAASEETPNSESATLEAPVKEVGEPKSHKSEKKSKVGKTKSSKEVINVEDLPTPDKNQFISKGRKGLYFKTKEGRLYFPEEGLFKDAAVGCVTDVTVVKEKGTYGFFTGTMVRDKAWPLKDALKVINIDGHRVWNGSFNGTDVVIQAEESEDKESLVYVVYADGGKFCTIEDELRASFFQKGSMFGVKYCSQLADILRCFRSEERCEDDAAVYLKVMKALLISSEVYYWNDTLKYGMTDVECMLYDSRVIFVHRKDSNWIYVQHLSDGRGCTASGDIAKWLKILNLEGSELLSAVDLNEMWAWAKENYVAFSKYCLKVDNKQVFFNAMFQGSEYTLQALNPVYCDMDYLIREDVVSSMKASRAGYSRWLKGIGKAVSKAMLPELTKMKQAERYKMGYNV